MTHRPVSALALVASLATAAPAQSPSDRAIAPRAATTRALADAVPLSAFGERPVFSPDSRRVAFIGKTYGDAFEIDLATREIRNLTGGLPHQGIARVQYLPSGDFLLTAPRVFEGERSRGRSELWLLRKDLRRGLMPLGQMVFEGVAVSRTSGRIAYAMPVGKSPRPGEIPPIAFFLADVDANGEQPRLVNRRRLEPKTKCDGEPQDFRDGDRELLVSCYVLTEPGRGYWSGAFGLKLASGELVTYRDAPAEYNELEGVAPDGSWTTVECAPRAKSGLSPIDICRLELRPGGPMTLLLEGEPGATRKVNNPVVSPDGRWMAFATADIKQSHGSGDGVMMIALR